MTSSHTDDFGTDSGTDRDAVPGAPPTASESTQAAVLAAAAAERRERPRSDLEAADRADSYDAMMRLAGLLDDSGEELRQRSTLGAVITRGSSFVDSAPLSPRTHEEAEDRIRAATTGKHGLFARSIELDADALVLRATVLTYRWIDELQQAAFETLGSIAGRAIGYLAPEVALGGAIVSAGLIETDALDRDGVAAYLSELAESNPELMEHVTSGGGGLLDGLQMRSLLTAGVLAGDPTRRAAAGGLRAIGVEPFGLGADAALRDVAVGVVSGDVDQALASSDPDRAEGTAPRDLTSLLGELEATTAPVVVRRVAAARYVVYLGGSPVDDTAQRLVTGDASGYAAFVVRCIAEAVEGDDARVMLVGAGQGGVTAAEVAATGSDRGSPTAPRFTIDQVVTAGAPSAHVPRIPATTRVLSLEDRSDPVALLGSLFNAGSDNRVTVLYDGDRDAEPGSVVRAGRVADAATHPDLLAELERMRELGFLLR
ncbi:MAG: hypothetical protein CMJ44_03850 [Pimelobacter sp.]|nr:hypothetical protein [Pimelobacter sp.]